MTVQIQSLFIWFRFLETYSVGNLMTSSSSPWLVPEDDMALANFTSTLFAFE